MRSGSGTDSGRAARGVRAAILGGAMALLTAGLASSAEAATFGFGCITGSSAINCATGVSQLSLEATPAAGGSYELVLRNTGPSAAVVKNVYFDGVASGVSVLSSSPGVSVRRDSSPGTLPGGTAVRFTTDLSFTARPPAPQNGVGPGEFVKFGVVTTGDLVKALGDGSVRIGLHVISFANGGSESFVTGSRPPAPAVPEPSAALVFGAGALLVGARIGRKGR